MRNLILYFCACIIGVVSYAQSSAYVGQTIYLNGLSYGVSGNASWYCDDGHSSCLRISGDGLYGASVYFEQYFSGTARIACQYVYYYYVGTKKQYVNGTDYYYVSCKPATTTLNKNSITLKPNETATLTGTCSSGYDLSMASWLTSDKNIVYFDGSSSTIGSGKTVTIVANKPGECDITCGANTNGKNPVCHVIVKSDPPQSISITPETLTLKEGKTGSLSYKLTPTNTFANVKWTSLNNNVATISSSGTVKAISCGTAIITATTDNGLSANATIEVVPIPQNVSLTYSAFVPVGYSIILKPELTPNNANTVFTWSSNNLDVVSVENGKCYGHKVGNAIVTVTTDNGKTASCNITVSEPSQGMNKKNVTLRTAVLKKLIIDSIKKIKF